MALNKKEFDDNKTLYINATNNGFLVMFDKKANDMLEQYFIAEKTIKNIADCYEISYERVRQLLLKYIKKLSYYDTHQDKIREYIRKKQ